MFNSYKMLDSPLPLWISALTGQGLKSAVFILVFQQVFNGYPISLDEAAELDGAGKYKVFFKIALPIAKPAIVLSMLFSFVWYWNESYLTEMYVHGVMTTSGWTTLVIQLDNFASNYSSYATTATNAATSLNESINMAGTMLSILPLLLMYLVLQRYFVESIDRTGITGE